MFTNNEILGICQLIMEKGQYGTIDPVVEYFLNNTISREDRDRLVGRPADTIQRVRELVGDDTYKVEIKITKNRKKRGK